MLRLHLPLGLICRVRRNGESLNTGEFRNPVSRDFDDDTGMSTINQSLIGLASSLLLNFGLTSLAEKLDPMLSDGRSIKKVLLQRSAAFSETVCNFQSAAFSETVCNFRSTAFSETVCNFTPQGS